MSLDDPMDDPRLTAHAMGESSGPLTPEEQAEVDAIRATAETLKAGFAATPMPTLDPAHRAAILQGLSGSQQGLSPETAKPVPGAVPGSVVRLSDYSGLGALAATLLLVIGFGVAGATGGIEMGARDVVVVGVTPTNGLESLRDLSDVGGTHTVSQFDGYGGGGGGGLLIRTGSGPKAIVNYGGSHNLRAVTNGLQDGASAGVDNGGVGVPFPSTWKVREGMRTVPLFSSSAVFNDGDYRGRSENISEDERRRLITIGKAKGQEVLALMSSNTMTVPDLRRMAGEVRVLRSRLGNLVPETGGVEDENMELVVDPKELRVTTQKFLDALDHSNSALEVLGDDDEQNAATESFLAIVENPWIRPYGEAALSTLSIDVDTAGYSIVRRSLLEQNRLPPPGAVRVEELVNYFPYAYVGPINADPFAVHVDAAACPWTPAHRLVRIALKGREIEEAVRPAANLVFLLDVSGSMDQPNKLPLVQKSIEMLTERLTARDRVAMVVYAGQSGLVLPSTPAGDHAAILEALGRLGAGGSTNGGAGIELAYKVAAENFVPGGINRVVLATDGDFNVGVSDPSALVKMVEEKAKTGVFLTALGYGMDNLKDSTLEQLADKGNGNYGYIDNLAEARKVLVEQGMSTLHCIAKDVKIQVEFNPAKVAGYRLLGYENRMLAAQDFADDQKDAGEIGAGHTVTALYEVVPAGVAVPGSPVDELRYQRPGAFSGNAETLVVKLRWKEPEGTVSTPREFPFVDGGLSFESGSEDFRFAAAVAGFGMVLRDSRCAGSANLDLVREIAAGALGADAGGYRAEFVTLVEKARTLKR